MRLQSAVGVSVLAHCALLALPAGRLWFPDRNAAASPQSTRIRVSTPAPLTVRLGPQSVRLVDGHATFAIKGGVAATAPVVDATSALSPQQAELADGTDDEIDKRTPVQFGIPAPEEYFGTKDVSEPPQLLSPPPGVPDDPMALPGSGTFIITLWLNESGLVDRYELISSQIDAKLEQVVVNQLRQARFSPAKRDGKPVKNRIKLQVDVLPPSSGTTETSAKEN